MPNAQCPMPHAQCSRNQNPRSMSIYRAIKFRSLSIYNQQPQQVFYPSMNLFSLLTVRIITSQKIKAAYNQKVEAQRFSFHLKFKVDNLVV